MGHHLTEAGHFKSDKYDWCPEDYFVLKSTDINALHLVQLYPYLAWLKRRAWCPDDFIVLDLENEDHRIALWGFCLIFEKPRPGGPDPELLEDLKVAMVNQRIAERLAPRMGSQWSRGGREWRD